MSLDWKLVLGLLVLLGAMQGGCLLLARGLGRRLERHVAALGMALPLLLLFPWLGRDRLLVPADILQDVIPGAPRVPASHRHDLLNDAVYQFLPWELEVRHALREGRLPLWSDALEGGSSPWVNPQAAPVSPIAMAARVLPIQHYLLVTLALKMLVAFEGVWLLARTVGVSRPASLIAGAGFALSGGMMAWALFPHTAALAWVPWLTAAVIVLCRGGDARAVATAAVLTAALLLSGHPETAALGGLFAAVCGLSLARRRSLLRGLGSAALAAVLGFGLAAPHVLPFALHLPQSQRAHETLAQRLPVHQTRLAQPVTWFLPAYLRLLLAPLNPRVYGRPYLDEFHGPINWVDAESGYAGLVSFAGAMVALLALPRRRAWPFLAFAGVSLLLAARFFPLVHLVFALRPLEAIALSRFLFLGSLAFAVAGGMGIDRLLARRRPAAALIALTIAAALSLAACFDLFVAGLWTLIAAAALAGRRRPALGMAGLALVLALDLGPWSRGMLPSTSSALFYPVTDFLALLRSEALRGGPWRAAAEERALFPSLLPVYGVDEVRPHNPLAPMPYLRTLEAAFGFAPTMESYFPAFLGIDHPFLDFLNVRVIAATASMAVPRTLERIDGGRFGPFRLYRNPDALPRWFLPSGVDVIRREELSSWIASLEDPRRVAVFDARAAGWVGASGEVAVPSRSPGRILLEVPGDGDRLLATSLPQPEGWTASRGGGRSLERVVVDGAFLGVHVPAGASRVELRFRPPGLAAGLVIGLASLAATAALLGRRRAAPRPTAWRRDTPCAAARSRPRRLPSSRRTPPASCRYGTCSSPSGSAWRRYGPSEEP
jgi:hypothetical protein